MEKKTLEEIMAEPATVEAIIKKAMEINELLLKVENMPEVQYNPDDFILVRGGFCHKCVFYKNQKCAVKRDNRFDCSAGHFESISAEVSSFNDVE